MDNHIEERSKRGRGTEESKLIAETRELSFSFPQTLLTAQHNNSSKANMKTPTTVDTSYPGAAIIVVVSRGRHTPPTYCETTAKHSLIACPCFPSTEQEQE